MRHIYCMKRWIACLILGFGIGLLTVSSANGQTASASLTGLVTDPTGAVVPGAKVTVTDEARGTVRQASTGSTGFFTVTNLGVGTYRLDISAPGFASYAVSGIALNSSQVRNVDVRLKLAHLGGTVVQVRGVTAISTQTTNISNLVTARDLAELPAGGVAREDPDAGIVVFELMNPGISSNRGDSSPNVAGVPQISVVRQMDGITVTANESNIGNAPIQPDMDAIQEVHIQLANTPAEFSAPAVSSVITKSGTNQYHGGIFWMWNGSSLNARNYFSSKVPFRNFNSFGANLGGPVRKNKTFFFGDYEGGRERAYAVVVGNTPLPPWRTGDFSGLSTPIVDPTTGLPFPNNKILPSSRISSVSQKTQDFFYPIPNFGAPGLESGNWRGQFPANPSFDVFDNFDVRVDHNFANGDRISGIGIYRRSPLINYFNFLPPIGAGVQVRSAEIASISWTHIFSSRLLNDVRYGFTRQENQLTSNFIGSDIISQIGMQGVSTVGIPGVPDFEITGITSTDVSDPDQDSLDTGFNFIDDLSWVVGRHSMKFGMNVIRDQIGGKNIPNSVYGVYNFTGIYTGSPYADFLLGIPQSTSLTVPTPNPYLRGTQWALYAQDIYRVTQNITLNYGLRWELDGPYYDRYGAIANFDPAIDGWVVPDDGLARVNPDYPTNIPVVAASTVGYPKRALVDLRGLNFYPRIGIAIRPFNNDKTVIRAGYGIFSVPIYGGLGRALTGGPFSGSVTYFNSITNGVPLFSFPNPFLPSGTLAHSENAFGISPNTSTPYTQQWNLTVERQLGKAALRVSYVGSHAVKLLYTRNLNQPHPSTTPYSPSERPYQNFQTITWRANGGDDEYNGLQVALAKNLGSNLTYNVGYTWSRDLTDTQSTGSFAGPQIQNQYDLSAEWGPNLQIPTNRVYGFVVYQLPFGKGQRFLNNDNLLTQTVLGGWQMAWDATAQSGLLFTPSYSKFDSSNTNTFGGRPDVVPGVSPKAVGKQTINNWFNPAAFKVPGCPDNDPVCAHPADVGRFGNLGIGTLTGPRDSNVDLTVSKFFPIYRNVRLQFQMNAADVFNHPVFAVPASNISSPGTVGRITSQVAPTLGGNAGRHINLMLRLQF